MVIDIRLLGRIYPDEVTTTLILITCLPNVLFEAKLRTLLHRFYEERVILRIVNCKLLNHLLQLLISLILEVVTRCIPRCRLKTCALDSIAETTLLSLPIEALHAVFDLIERLFLAIESLQTDQGERVCNQIALDTHIQW